MYDPKSDTWSHISDMHSARDGACNASDGEVIYVIGGYDGSDYSLTTEVYRPESGEWDNTCKFFNLYQEIYNTLLYKNQKIYNGPFFVRSRKILLSV